MKTEYDLSNRPARKNPYAARLNQPASAEAGESTQAEQAWAAETARRIAEIDSGVVQLLPLDEVLAEIRAKLK